MTGEFSALMRCADCKTVFMECPDCVNTVRIDPQTGYPPDVLVENGKGVHNPNPSADAVARWVKQPVCDGCITHRNDVVRHGGPNGAHIEGETMLAADRHRLHHG